jgi:hypothetical protein
MNKQHIRLTIDGILFEAPPAVTIIQAYATSDTPLLKNVGCMGQGVCGSCCCMVRRASSSEVKVELACETLIEDGMQVSFIDYFTPGRPHVYQIEDVADSWRVNAQLNEIFPEARHCRHCSGCDRACPRDIEVQRGIDLASSGDIRSASDVFETAPGGMIAGITQPAEKGGCLNRKPDRYLLAVGREDCVGDVDGMSEGLTSPC